MKIAIDYRTQYEAAEARIQDLEEVVRAREQDRQELYEAMKIAHARIRELEADKAAYMKDVDDIGRERNLYEERIQKAREILLDSTYPLDDKICDRVNAALDALEGK